MNGVSEIFNSECHQSQAAAADDYDRQPFASDEKGHSLTQRQYVMFNRS